MSKPEDIQNKNLARKISLAQLSEFLQQFSTKNNVVFCPVCKKSDWILPVWDKDKTKPVIITQPLPDSDGVGMWLFPVICEHCTYTMHFSTPHIVKKLQAEGKL
ncbi:Uncharacterised protein [Yersinia nurmii]|uniref:Uncharacterized protein n=1 Tax=Yersinia nurmii TaxID=685706 RepID=A0ABM9SN51_9GAMM|nr:hypothetical protein [Yersinia nurmii]CNF30403.1 Uncharacterised protein [Yersinia nurmii]